MFWVIHLIETDGDIMLWPCKDQKAITDYINLMELHSSDYAIIEGLKHKDFNHLTYDLKRS